LLGKLRVIVPPAIGDTSPPALVVKENVTVEAYLPVERSSAVMLKKRSSTALPMDPELI
jgi:hypothetical protein